MPDRAVADQQDIVLDADASLDIAQQKKIGLGSFFNFKVSYLVLDTHSQLMSGTLSG